MSGADGGASAGKRGWPAHVEWMLVGAALLASLALLGFATRQPLVEAAYAGGLLVLSAVAFAAVRRAMPAPTDRPGEPDWSVTCAAVHHSNAAIAITDHEGRLVCANTVHESWFGADAAPPALPFADAGPARLAEAARIAWRDGAAQADALVGGADGIARRCVVTRAGRGEGFLVWRISQVAGADPVAGLLADPGGGALGAMLSRAGLMAALVDPRGTIVAANAAFAQAALGDVAQTLVHQDFFALLQRDDRGRIGWARDNGLGSALTLFHVPLADTDADAGAAPGLMLIAPAGEGVGGAGGRDDAQPPLEALLSQLPHGLAMTDRDGRLLFANPAFMRAAGREGGEPPLYPSDLVVREDKTALADAVRRHARDRAHGGDIAVRLAARPDDPVSLSLAGVRGLGEAAVLLGLTDTTEETRLRRQVAQATKMQAIGQLAGGIAHDFNNVLTAILATCDLMLLRHTPGDSDYDDIQQIRAASNRAASLTRQLLAFSRQQTLRPEVLQLPDVVAESTQLLRRLIGETVALVVAHDRDLAPVRADPGQLGQVIMNLVVNARDAIHARGDGRGRIEVSTRRVRVTDRDEARREIVPPGEYTALIVADDGGGIAAKNLPKIFEPFFTTKEHGKGTGLGLSTVYGFVKQSGGFVFADSTPGRGSTFTVYLPGHHAAVEATAPPRPRGTPGWGADGRILLVEDEDPVRLVAERALVRQGYAVTTARDGEEGVALVRGGGGFDLVVSDVVMPAMDGPAMAREIRKLAPALPVLFMSGYAEEQLRKEIDMANVHFLPKPFSVQQISDKVGEVLAEV